MSLNVEQTHDRTERPVATLHTTEAQDSSRVRSALMKAIRSTLMMKYFVKELKNPLLIMTRVMNQCWWTRRTWTSEFQDYHIPLGTSHKVAACATSWRRPWNQSCLVRLKNWCTMKLTTKTQYSQVQNIHVSWRSTSLRESALERLNSKLGTDSTRWKSQMSEWKLEKLSAWQMTNVMIRDETHTHRVRLLRLHSHNKSNHVRKSEITSTRKPRHYKILPSASPVHASHQCCPLTPDRSVPETWRNWQPQVTEMIVNFMAPTTFRWASEQTEAPLLFDLEITFSTHSILWEAVPTKVFLSQISVGLRLSRPYFAPLWLHDRSLRCPSSRISPQIIQSHRSPGKTQILFARIVTHIHKPSLSSCRTSKLAGNIPSFCAKVRRKREVIKEVQQEGMTVHFATLMDARHLKNLEWSRNSPQIKRRKFVSITNDGRKK